MEIYVGLSFKFAEQSVQDQVVEALSVGRIGRSRDYSSLEEQIQEVKNLLNVISNQSDLFEKFEYFDTFAANLEFIKENKSGSVSFNYTTTWGGDVFANELKTLLKSMRAKNVRISARGDEG